MENKPESQSQSQSQDIKREQDKSLEGLPKDSPYLQYDNLEDYKKKGYGTQGHIEPKPGRGAGASVDAPTLSGGSVTSQNKANATQTINREGVP